MKYTVAFALASAANARLMGAYGTTEYTTPAPTDNVNGGGYNNGYTPAPTDNVSPGTPAPTPAPVYTPEPTTSAPVSPTGPTPCPEPTEETTAPVSPVDPYVPEPCSPSEDIDDIDNGGVETPMAYDDETNAPATNSEGYDATKYSAGSAATTSVAFASIVLPIVAYML